jgi:cell division protein FtsB
MGDKKLNVLIAVLVIITAAATYITINIPPPQDKQIAKIKAQTEELQAQVNDLQQDVKRLTHPAVMQQRTLDWVLDKGEFERGDK